MKDIYSPLEIDEQWDQRAPMVEGDAFDAMVQMAPDDASGGGVATIEQPAMTAEQPTVTNPPTEQAQATEGMMPIPAESAAPMPEPIATPADGVAMQQPEATMPTTDDQSVASLEGQGAGADVAEAPHIIPEPRPLSETPEDTSQNTEAPEPSAGDVPTEDVQPEDAMPHTVPPIEQYQPDPGNERPLSTEPTESDQGTTPAPAEDVAKLDEAVAELPTSPTKLVVDKKDTEDDDRDKEDDKKGDKLVVETEDDEVDADVESSKDKKPDAHRKQAIESLTHNIAELNREVEDKEKAKKEHEDRRDDEIKKISDLQAEIDFKKSEIAAFESAKAALTEQL